MEQISNFIQQYFIDPITYGTGYNIYNTLAYAIIFIVAALLVYRLLKFMKIRIDNKLLFGIIPYVVLGGLLRALEDAAVVSGFIFKTPMIYFLVFVIAVVTLAISVLVERKVGFKYQNTWFIIGIVLLVFGFSFVKMVSVFSLVTIIGITLFFVLATIAIKKYAMLKEHKSVSKFLSKENLLLLNTHMFDASTTFTAIQFFPYFEQHVVPGFLIGIFGPVVMFPLKLVVVSVVLYVLDRELKKNDLEKRNFIKLLILILGLAPGLRNLLRLVMGV